MIKISGGEFTLKSVENIYTSNNLNKKIIDTLNGSSNVYNYISLEKLKFEIDLRRNIVLVSRELYKSDVEFKVFRKTTCNKDYWERTKNGGFLLKKGVEPSRAIKDIFINSSKYGTECATAMMIVYYKAILNVFKDKLFNKLYPVIFLMDWINEDDNLPINYYESSKDFLPGDCRYFENPDVDPLTPEWQGENVIDLGDGNYFGHGIGVQNGKGIISKLNSHRKKGAIKSAYLLNTVKYPDFNYLEGKTKEGGAVALNN